MPLMPGAQVEFGSSGETELAYVEYTVPVNLSATTEATANTIVTAPAVVVDGSTTIIIEFFCPALASPGGGTSRFSLVHLFVAVDGGAAGAIGQLADVFESAASQVVAPCLARRFLTPAAGSLVYSARGHVTGGTGVANAGTGGGGTFMPGYLRITG